MLYPHPGPLCAAPVFLRCSASFLLHDLHSFAIIRNHYYKERCVSMKQQRNTRQRQLVLDVVRGRRDHPTAEQIYQSVREQDAHVSRGTVYRNLNLLCDNREIYRVVMSSSDRFDLRTDPHYHMHCLVCDSVVDVPYTYDCAYDETLEQETGYRVLCHHMVVEGVCPDCQRSETGSVQ